MWEILWLPVPFTNYMHRCHPFPLSSYIPEAVSGFLDNVVLSVISFIIYIFKLYNSFWASSYHDQIVPILKKKISKSVSSILHLFSVIIFYTPLENQICCFWHLLYPLPYRTITVFALTLRTAPSNWLVTCVTKSNGFFSGHVLLNKPLSKYSLALASFETSHCWFSFYVYSSLF